MLAARWQRVGRRGSLRVGLVLGLLGFWLAHGLARGATVAATESGKLRVLTSFMPIYCFAVNVAGDAAEVQNLLPGNVGPHDYQPTRSDYEKVAAADLLLLNGLKLEDWVQRMVKSRGNKRPLKIVELSKGLEAAWIRDVPSLPLDTGSSTAGSKRDHDHDHDHDHGHGHGHDGADANPHLWLDPVLAIHSVSNVLRVFQQADPARASVYAANAESYIQQLRGLDEEYRTKLLGAPAKAPFIAYHDAFVYLARRYQLQLVGVIEEIPEVTPSIRYQDALKRAIVKHQVKVIFAEPQFPQKLAAQLSRDTGVPLALLDTLETSADGKLTRTSYIESMRSNLSVLSRFLR